MGKGSVVWDILGDSWVVIRRVISSPIWARTIVTLLLSRLITSHEPPSRAGVSGFQVQSFLGFWGISGILRERLLLRNTGSGFAIFVGLRDCKSRLICRCAKDADRIMLSIPLRVPAYIFVLDMLGARVSIPALH